MPQIKPTMISAIVASMTTAIQVRVWLQASHRRANRPITKPVAPVPATMRCAKWLRTRMPGFIQTAPLWGLIALFAASAAAVWFAGSRLAGLVDAITERTGMGQAFTGMLLLGGVTSLPEVAAVSTSAAYGNAPLAINNLLGTASINVLLLALADIVYGRDALTAKAARPGVLMQGVLSMLLAALVALIATAGDVALFGVGAGATLLAVAAVGALWLSSGFADRHTWEAVDEEGRPERDDEGGGDRDERSTARLVGGIVGCALLILGAGFLLSVTADATAQRTGLAAGLVGFVRSVSQPACRR